MTEGVSEPHPETREQRIVMTEKEFDRQFEAHRKRLLAYAQRCLGNAEAAADAEDAVQEAYLRARRSLVTFDPSKGSLSQWLYRIVFCVCSVTLEWRKKLPTVSLHEPMGTDGEPGEKGDTLPDTAPTPEESYLQKEMCDRLALCVGKLPDNAREVVVLRELYGYSPEETAHILGVNVNTLGSRLSRALPLLRKCLESRF